MAYRIFGPNFEIPSGNLPHGNGYTVGPTGSNADYVCDGVADQVEINQAITDAFNSATVSYVKLLEGTYSVSDTILMKTGVSLVGVSYGSVKITAATNFNYAGTSGIITALGAETTSTPITLSVNLIDGYNIVQVSTAGASGTEFGLVTNGDYLFLVSNSIWDSNSEQAVRYTGEYIKVSTKSANSFTIHGMTRSNYNTADNARLYRMNFVSNISVENLEITQSSPIKTIANAGNCVLFQKTYNASVKNCIFHDFDGAGVGLWNVIKAGIYNNQMYNLTDDTTDGYFGYGVVCGGSSEQVVIAENHFDYIRHALTTGYPAKVTATIDGYGISRNVNFVNNVVTHANNSAIDTHAQSDGINISNNSISSCITWGVFTRGIGTHIMSNDIEWCGGGISVGISPQTSGGSGSGSMVVGNTIKHMTQLSATTTNGVVSNSGQGIVVTQTDNVIVSGNTIIGCDNQGIFFNIYAKNCVVQDNVIMNANLLNSSNIGAIGLGGAGAGTGTLAFSTPTVTLTTTGSPFNTNFFAGQVVTISGATNPTNNGTFTVTGYPTANTFTYSNASGVAGDSVTFVIECITDCYFINNTAINTPASRYDANVTGHAKYLVFDSGLTGAGGNLRNVFKNNTGFNMETGLFNSQNAASFFAGNSRGEGNPTKAVATTPVDASFVTTPEAGSLAVDTANSILYFRDGSSWLPATNKLVGVGGILPVLSTATAIQWLSTVVLPELSQATVSTNGVTATDLLIKAQAASGTTSTGGSIQLRAGTGTSANGAISIRAGGNTFMNLIPGGTNAGVGAASISLNSNVTSFGLLYTSASTTTNGGVLTIQSQSTGSLGDGYVGGDLRLTPGSGNSPTNSSGGNVLVDAPLGKGTGTNGSIQLRSATTTVFTITPSLTLGSNTGISQIQLAAANAGFNLNQADKTTNGGTGAPFTIQAQNETGTTSTGGDLVLQSGTGTTQDGYITLGTSAGLGIRVFANPTGTNTIQFVAGAIAATINQAQTTSTNGAQLTVLAQQTTNSGSTGGPLVLSAGPAIGAAGTGGSVFLRAQTGNTANGTIQLALGVNTAATFTPAPTGNTSLAFVSTATSITVNQLQTASASGALFTVQAQNSTFNTGSGGGLLLKGGNNSGTTSTGGSVQLQAGTGTSANGSVVFGTTAGDVLASIMNPTGASSFNWTSPVTSVSLAQTATSVANGANWTINAQDSSFNGGTAGDLILKSGTASGTTSTAGRIIFDVGTGTLTNGNIRFRQGGVDAITINTIDPLGGIQWNYAIGATSVNFLQTTATATNGASWLMGAQATSLNGGTGGTTVIRGGGATGTTSTGGGVTLSAGVGSSTNGTLTFAGPAGNVFTTVLNHTAAANWLWANTLTSIVLKQSDNTTNGATGSSFTIQSQNATGTTATGGSLNLNSGTGTTVAGNVNIQTGAVTRVSVNPTFTIFSDTAEGIRVTPSSTGSGIIGFASTAATGNIRHEDTAAGSGGILRVQAQRAIASGAGGTMVVTAGDGYTTGGSISLRVGTSMTTPGTTNGNILFQTGQAGLNGTPLQFILSNISTTSINASNTVTAFDIQHTAATATDGYTLSVKAQSTNRTSGLGGQLVLQAGNGTGTTATGGDVTVTSGTGTTVAGNVNIQTGGTTIAQITPSKLISSKGRRHNITTITGTYTVLTTDEIIIVTTNAAAFTVTLPASPVTGDIYEIKDGVGNAAARNITIAGNGKTIDGVANYALNINYGALLIAYNGTEWSIL